MLEVRNLKTYYYIEDSIIKAADGVNFNVGDGEFVGLAGASGCGKSTIGLSLMKLINPPGKILKGHILLDGIEILDLNEKELEKFRGTKISMIFQDPYTCLNPVISIGEQISEGIRFHLQKGKKEAKDRAIELLKLVKISNPGKKYDSYPHELSGGMRQRVMIAIALSCGAKYIIADEPTTALDVTTQKQVMELLKELQNQYGLSILLISHNKKLLAKYCKRILFMDRGKITKEKTI